jgi:hypothetical protein
MDPDPLRSHRRHPERNCSFFEERMARITTIPRIKLNHIGQAAIQRRNRDGLCALNGRPFGLVA